MNKKWTQKEIELLKKEYPNLNNSYKDFTRMFNRSKQAILIKTSRLKIKRFTSDFNRFISKVNKNSGKFFNGIECWEWTAGKDTGGYGLFDLDQKSIKAHRFSYEYFIGSIPDDMFIDHMCKNHPCVNPNHLRIVTPRINAIENNCGPTAINFLKTHCIRGHEFTKENTYIVRGSNVRQCKKCHNISSLERYHNKKNKEVI